MAITPRSVASIKAQIVASIQANPVLYDPSNPDPTKRGLTSTSMVAIWNAWAFIAAVTINLFEQIIALFQTQIDARINELPAGSPAWIIATIKRFQWSPTTAQVVQLINGFIVYPIINTSLQIITQCSVSVYQSGNPTIKVASNSAPLTAPQIASLTSYYTQYTPCMAFNIRSVPADFLMVGATIFYNGQYNSVIIGTVQAAITDYIGKFNIANFDSTISLSGLEQAILAVPGVSDVVFNQVEARAYNIPVVDALKMVNLNTELVPKYNPFAGYLIIDTVGGRTLNDTLIFAVG